MRLAGLDPAPDRSLGGYSRFGRGRHAGRLLAVRADRLAPWKRGGDDR